MQLSYKLQEEHFKGAKFNKRGGECFILMYDASKTNEQG